MTSNRQQQRVDSRQYTDNTWNQPTASCCLQDTVCSYCWRSAVWTSAVGKLKWSTIHDLHWVICIKGLTIHDWSCCKHVYSYASCTRKTIWRLIKTDVISNKNKPRRACTCSSPKCMAIKSLMYKSRRTVHVKRFFYTGLNRIQAKIAVQVTKKITLVQQITSGRR